MLQVEAQVLSDKFNSRSRLKNSGEIREFILFVNRIHLAECVHCACEGV